MRARALGEVFRHGVEWKFRAVGQGFARALPVSRPATASMSGPSGRLRERWLRAPAVR
ncbi:TerD family protein [Streptomyces sp. NPDC056653]|uniref:TerD family protein n=1 Tax=Streptomyces sp. NPDC056653 TaxID=3345894 RepID=UPI0036CA74FA